MGKICIWQISRLSESEVKSSKLVEFRHHETAVYSLVLGEKQVWTGMSLSLCTVTVLNRLFDVQLLGTTKYYNALSTQRIYIKHLYQF